MTQPDIFRSIHAVFAAALVCVYLYYFLRQALMASRQDHYRKNRLYLLKPYPNVTWRNCFEVALCGAVTCAYFLDFSSGSLWSQWSWYGLALIILILWKISLSKLLHREMEVWDAFVRKHLKPFPEGIKQLTLEMHQERAEKKRRNKV